MKDQPEGGEFVLFCLIYYSLPLLKMTIFVLIRIACVEMPPSPQKKSRRDMSVNRRLYLCSRFPGMLEKSSFWL